MNVVLHIAAAADWDPDADEYRHPTLDSQGFIHCSDPEQVVAVAEHNYADRDDLCLLCIDADRVDSDVVYEALGDATEPYPHVYGPLDTDAVIEVVPFPRAEGGFELPDRVRELSDGTT